MLKWYMEIVQLKLDVQQHVIFNDLDLVCNCVYNLWTYEDVGIVM
jgi:hypothetical protein